MNTIIEWIISHAETAHLYVFFAIVLAGFNIPLCLDLLVLISAFIAASVLPSQLWPLFFSVFFGCLCSANCAYWMGRLLGNRWPCRKFLKPTRMEKIRHFYERYGMWTLIMGRFIPFGVRNCLFMTSGASRLSFPRFLFMDLIACSIWCTTSFSLFYFLGQYDEKIWSMVKTINFYLFGAFGVTLIASLWYKSKQRNKKRNVQSI